MDKGTHFSLTCLLHTCVPAQTPHLDPVLNPNSYLLAREGAETSDIQAVMDGGGLEPFITAWLRHKGRQATEGEFMQPQDEGLPLPCPRT